MPAAQPKARIVTEHETTVPFTATSCCATATIIDYMFYLAMAVNNISKSISIVESRSERREG